MLGEILETSAVVGMLLVFGMLAVLTTVGMYYTANPDAGAVALVCDVLFAAWAVLAWVWFKPRGR